MMTSKLIPSWAVKWYLIICLVLPYDWVFIMFRSRIKRQELGRLLFSPMYLYGTYDKVFGDENDLVVFYIYIVGFFDCLASLFILYSLIFDESAAKSPKLSTLIVAQSAEMSSKTLIYIMYSWASIEKSMRIPITLMNGAFTVVPLLLISSVAEGFHRAIAAKKDQ